MISMSDERAKEGTDLGRELVRERVRGKLFGSEAPPAVSIGRFELRDKLGEGAMGAVYRAFDPELEREVAVKVVRSAALATSTTDDDRLLREAQAMARLAHPNVVTVHEVGRHAGGVFIAMELVAGGTLRAWLEAAPRSPEEVVSKLLAAGRGLSAAHERGLIHRDFKPENVLVGDDGRPRVVDFGLVSMTAAAGGPASVRNTTTTTGGTPRYMSPEQLRGEYCDSLSDQFNFCATLFESLYGKPPFSDASLEDRIHAIAAGRLAPVGRHPAADLLPPIRRGLSPSPAERFPTMAALLTALESILRRRANKRRVRHTLLALGSLGVLVGGVATAAALWPDDPPPPKPKKRKSKRRPADRTSPEPHEYVELTRLVQLGEYDACIDYTRRYPPTAHMLNLRIECASKAKRQDVVRSACKTYRAEFEGEEVPAYCTDAHEEAQRLYEAGKYEACIDAAERGKPDIMLVVQMYQCAAKMRDRATYVRVCKYASTHFPERYPAEQCPKPL